MFLSRLEKSLSLRDSIVAKSIRTIQQNTNNEEDHFFMHILDCIGALSCIRADQKNIVNSNMEGSASALLASKHRVFWQAVREIADREVALEDIATTAESKSIQKKSSLDCVLESFPDDAKGTDGRMWLPLHLAVTLPAVHLSDIHTIFTSNPAAIKIHANETSNFNPCHLAAMMKNPRLEIIRRLQIYYPLLGSSLDCDSNTPLHLAVCYSDSVAMVRELAQLHPAALEMKSLHGDTPLNLAAKFSGSVEVVRELAQLYPAALGMKSAHGDTPLHRAASYSDNFEMVRELAQLYPAALAMTNSNGDTPLHRAARYSDSVAIVRELAQLHPAALDTMNVDGNTPLHLAVEYSGSVEILQALVSLSPAALVTLNGAGKTPLAVITSYYDYVSGDYGKLQVLVEAAPQAAGIARLSDGSRLPLHQILYESRSSATAEMVAMLLAAYKEAVNIPDDEGMLPIHIAVQCAPPGILKMVAEANISNISMIAPSYGSVAHIAVFEINLEHLRYIHAMMPELLYSLDDWNKTPIHRLIHVGDEEESLRQLSSPLSANSDVLRFLLRHCPSLASAKDSDDNTLYDRLPADNPGLFYARRLLLLAGASSLYPSVLQEMNYAARRAALLLFYSSATEPSIFSRIRHAAGGPVLMRTIVTFL